ncbi:putative ORFan [Tupanvirus deep ocean]|uniref:ORFan n=2 Tax=Tupanvirus TaxID=2094720 RepID=A0AC62A8U2_9VIRU|nr:putative ORFan [Tupanvirus deep ocean]QKU34144.1 putative ORFan [Tupanvirus deep ocean]
MGILNSTLKTQNITQNNLFELYQDKIIYRSKNKNIPFVVLYFENDIAPECHLVLSKIKNNGGSCKVSYDQSKIMVIHDNETNITYPSKSTSPSTFGWVKVN